MVNKYKTEKVEEVTSTQNVELIRISRQLCLKSLLLPRRFALL